MPSRKKAKASRQPVYRRRHKGLDPLGLEDTKHTFEERFEGMASRRHASEPVYFGVSTLSGQTDERFEPLTQANYRSVATTRGTKGTSIRRAPRSVVRSRRAHSSPPLTPTRPQSITPRLRMTRLGSMPTDIPDHGGPADNNASSNRREPFLDIRQPQMNSVRGGSIPTRALDATQPHTAVPMELTGTMSSISAQQYPASFVDLGRHDSSSYAMPDHYYSGQISQPQALYRNGTQYDSTFGMGLQNSSQYMYTQSQDTANYGQQFSSGWDGSFGAAEYYCANSMQLRPSDFYYWDQQNSD